MLYEMFVDQNLESESTTMSFQTLVLNSTFFELFGMLDYSEILQFWHFILTCMMKSLQTNHEFSWLFESSSDVSSTAGDERFL